MSLVIEHLNVRIDDKVILQDLSFTIAPGELQVITGPNGSGKSTLAQVITGLCDLPTTVNVLSFAGHDLRDQAIHERARLGIFLAWQQPVVLPGLKNAYFLKEMLALRQTAPLSYPDFLKKLNQALQDLGLETSFKSREMNVGSSGGEKKRLEILQMMLLEPQLVILDETDSGLDLDALQKIRDLILKMRDGKRSFLVISHNPEFAHSLHPDKVGILVQGQLKALGDASLLNTLKAQGFKPWEAS